MNEKEGALNNSRPIMRELNRLVKYTGVGLGSLVLDLILLWFFTEQIGVYYVFSAMIAFVFATISNY